MVDIVNGQLEIPVGRGHPSITPRLMVLTTDMLIKIVGRIARIDSDKIILEEPYQGDDLINVSIMQPISLPTVTVRSESKKPRPVKVVRNARL